MRKSNKRKFILWGMIGLIGLIGLVIGVFLILTTKSILNPAAVKSEQTNVASAELETGGDKQVQSMNLYHQYRIEDTFYAAVLTKGGIEVGWVDCTGHLKRSVQLEQVIFEQLDTNNTSIAAVDQKGKFYYWEKDIGFAGQPTYPMGDKLVRDFSLGDVHQAVVTDAGELYIWGKDTYSQLGVSTGISNLDEPTLLNVWGKSIVKVSCGPLNTIAITDQGEVYKWGHVEQNLAGFEEVDAHAIAVPAKIELTDQIIDADSSFFFDLLLTKDGKLLGSGRNEYGQAVPGNTSSYIEQYTPIDLAEPIVQIDLGKDHALARTDSGQVYAWGRNQYGQLGRAKSAKQGIDLIEWNGKIQDIVATNNHSLFLAPNQIGLSGAFNAILSSMAGGTKFHSLFVDYQAPDTAAIDSVTEISSGFHQSALIDLQGNAYTWGFDGDGGLGRKQIGRFDKPLKLGMLDNNCRQISTIQGTTTILTKTGEIFNFGNNYKGRLGIGNNLNQWEPVKVNLPDKVSRFFAGHSSTIAQTETGEWYAWGNNYFGSLLNGDQVYYATPIKIELPFGVAKIAGYATHSLILTDKGEVYQYGTMFSPGEIDLEKIHLGFQKVNFDEKIIDVAVGLDAGLVVSETGKVYAWGDNQSGKIGLPEKEFYDRPAMIAIDSKIKQIAVSPFLFCVVALTETGEVYTWGVDNMTGAEDRIYYMDKPIKLELREKISQMAVGDSDVYVIAELGNIYHFFGGITDKITLLEYKFVP